MIKAVSWFRRRPAMSVEEFQRYWREEHPKVVLELPGLCKYVQNHVLESQYAGGRQPFADGVVEWRRAQLCSCRRSVPVSVISTGGRPLLAMASLQCW